MTVVALGSRRASGKVWVGLVGTAAILATWTLLSLTIFARSGTLPTPFRVLARLASDGLGFYWPNAIITVREALHGYFWGVLCAILLAALVSILPRAERPIMQFGVVTYCVPIVAIGPVIYLIVGAPGFGQPSMTAIVLAALAVFFTTLMNTILGFKSADQGSLDLVAAYGGSAWVRFVKVRVPAALPAIIGGLKIAAPSALLGAILGEYVGGVDRGLGPAMVNAQQHMDAERTWAIAVVCAIIAGSGFALLSLVELAVKRYHGGALAVGSLDEPGENESWWTSVLVALASIIGLIVLWAVALKVFQVSPYAGKNPIAVAGYLFDPESGGERRSVLFSDIVQTLLDAGIGFVAGLLAAAILACVFVLVPAISHAFMPLVMLVRTVPLIALAPVIILIFGRGTATLAMMGGVIVFFPALVNLTLGLNAAPKALVDLVRVYGGSEATILFKVRIAACLPALFASIRVALPGAIAGALLAEWLATGSGVGDALISAIGRANNSAVWANVAAITGTSLVLYFIAVGLERTVIRLRNG